MGLQGGFPQGLERQVEPEEDGSLEVGGSEMENLCILCIFFSACPVWQ